MDESDADFEFDFFHEHPTATAEDDEGDLWEESVETQPRRRPAPAPPSSHVVRRRRIVAGAVVALVLLIILIVFATSGSGGGGGGTYTSYLSDLSGIASDSQTAGASLGTLSGKTAVSKLDTLIQQTVDDVNRLQGLTPPTTLASQQSQALAALDLRLLGLQQLRTAFAQTGSNVSPDDAVATLAASDTIWENAARTPGNAVLQARGLGGVYPSSTFVSNPTSLTKSLGTLLGSTGTTPTGAVLKLGSSGQDVVAWQNALNQWLKASGSTLTPLTADGNFGAGTQAATVALQNAAGLAPDGVVGPTTRQALQQQLRANKASTTGGTSAATAGPTLKLGDTGQDVVDWQTKLNQWLQATAPSQTQLSTDGTFGQGTLQATEQLQTAAGLTPTGQVDAATRQALASALAGSSPNRG